MRNELKALGWLATSFVIMIVMMKGLGWYGREHADELVGRAVEQSASEFDQRVAAAAKAEAASAAQSYYENSDL